MKIPSHIPSGIPFDVYSCIPSGNTIGNLSQFLSKSPPGIHSGITSETLTDSSSIFIYLEIVYRKFIEWSISCLHNSHNKLPTLSRSSARKSNIDCIMIISMYYSETSLLQILPERYFRKSSRDFFRKIWSLL